MNRRKSKSKKRSRKRSRRKVSKKKRKEYIQAAQIIGTRDYQEDMYFIEKLPNNIIFAGIFDGHGGNFCSKFVSRVFNLKVKKTLLHSRKINMDYQKIMKDAIKETSDEWDKISIPNCDKGKNQYTSGTTALSCLIVDNIVYMLWIGDSRAVWKLDDDPAIFATKDHNPSQKDIPKGSDAFIEGGRLNGILSLGRSIGDNSLDMRGALKREPSCTKFIFYDKLVLIMGSDGLYHRVGNNTNIMKQDYYINFATQLLNEKKKKKTINPFFRDNTTVLKIQIDL
jgi:serine/threonine protein phosphatase PrpC